MYCRRAVGFHIATQAHLVTKQAMVCSLMSPQL